MQSVLMERQRQGYGARHDLLSLRYVLDFFGPDLGRRLIVATRREGAADALPTFVTVADFGDLCQADVSISHDEGHGCTRRPLPQSTGGMVFAAVNEMNTVGEGMERFAALAKVRADRALIAGLQNANAFIGAIEEAGASAKAPPRAYDRQLCLIALLDAVSLTLTCLHFES